MEMLIISSLLLCVGTVVGIRLSYFCLTKGRSRENDRWVIRMSIITAMILLASLVTFEVGMMKAMKAETPPERKELK
jgi:small neutral amino acid transporter SnatA (MarC family)